MTCYGSHSEPGGETNSGRDPLSWRRRLRKYRRRRARGRTIVKPSRDIFNNPVDTLNNVVSSHSTTRHNRPLVGLDPVQVKSLKRDQSTVFTAQSGVIGLTIRISPSVSAPLISCLFANTSKDAPASLYQQRPSDNTTDEEWIDFTSSCSRV